MMRVTNGDYDNNADKLELFFTFCSPNVVAMSIAVFLLVKKVQRVPRWLEAALKDVNRCGFGIYCVHYAFIGAVFHWLMKPLCLPVALQLPLTSLVAFLIVWALVHCARKTVFRKLV